MRLLGHATTVLHCWRQPEPYTDRTSWQATGGTSPVVRQKPFIVLGDLNDYLETDGAGSTGIGAPDIARKGRTTQATLYTGLRFPEVGEKSPVASDHCPVVLDLTL